MRGTVTVVGTRLWLTLFVVAIIAAAACSADSDDLAPIEGVETTTGVSITPPETSAATTATTAPADEDDAETGDLEQVWAAVWTAAGRAEADKATAIDQVADHRSPEALETVTTLFQGEVERQILNHPVVSETAAGGTFINDCLYIRPPARVGTANWYQAEVSKGADDQWVIETITLSTTSGCVPKTVSDEIIADYLDFRDARAEYWNPADPHHPRIPETLTGVQIGLTIDLLEKDAAGDIYFVDGDTTYNPEVSEVVSPTEVIIIDCILPTPERGYFTGDGELLEGEQQPIAGQRDVHEINMTLEDGRWKVSNSGSSASVDCPLAPSINGVPQV